MQIKKAERRQVKIRMGISGPAGSGKSMSALLIAHGMCGDWSKICVIDTENGRANYYAHLGEYSTIEITGTYETEKYIKAIEMAEQAGFEVIIVDSMTHAWNAPGGILALVDSLTANTKLNNFTAWGVATPKEQAFRQRILASKAHIICTFRSKVETTLVDGKVKKMGMKVEYREGIEYEFTLFGEMHETQMHLTKDNTQVFPANKPFLPCVETGQQIINWCLQGSPTEVKDPAVSEEEKASAMKYYLSCEKLYTSFGQEKFWEANKAKIALMPLDRVKAAYRYVVEQAKVKLSEMEAEECLFFCEKLPAEIQKLPWIEEIIKSKVVF
jgi:archaellum biogenesis ATPase FlaH